MQKWQSMITSPIWRLFWGANYRNSLKYLILFTTNLFAALLEGLSYALILFSFLIISSDTSPDFASYAMLSKSHLSDFLFQFSQVQLFAGFITLAIGLQVIRSLLTYYTTYQTIVVSYQLLKQIQVKIYKQIFRMTFSFVNKYKTGDLVEYIRTPANYCSIIMDNLNKLVLHIIMVMICFAMMVWLEWRLTALTFCLYGMFLLLQKYVMKKIADVSKDQADEFARFNKYVVQNMQSIRTLHIYNQQKTALEKIKIVFQAIAHSTKRINLWHCSIPALNEVFGICLVGTILVVGVTFFHETSSAILSTLLTFLILAYRMSTKSQAALTNIGTIHYHLGSVCRLNDILKDEDKDFMNYSGQEFDRFTKSIAFDSVSFKYSENTPQILTNLSFKLTKGTITALVGLSGAGKSTILDLLVRLYNPTGGQILIDDVNIQNYNVKSWRNLFGVVCQDVCLFNETVEENILFGFEPQDSNAVIEAAKIAEAHEFIMKLSNGYQTVIGERGHRLSGGEKQRLSLARAIVRNPKILILDEATSHLDSHTETQFQKALAQFRQDRTILVVAHRLSTVIDADSIIVMEHGKIIEQGNHSSLLVANERYASLWNKQQSGSENMDQLYEDSLI